MSFHHLGCILFITDKTLAPAYIRGATRGLSVRRHRSLGSQVAGHNMMIHAKLFDEDSGQYKLLLQLHSTVLVAQLVKNPPAMQETWVQFLAWEDRLEKE